MIRCSRTSHIDITSKFLLFKTWLPELRVNCLDWKLYISAIDYIVSGESQYITLTPNLPVGFPLLIFLISALLYTTVTNHSAIASRIISWKITHKRLPGVRPVGWPGRWSPTFGLQVTGSMALWGKFRKCHGTFLSIQAKTCRLYIALYTIILICWNPLLAKSTFQSL